MISKVQNQKSAIIYCITIISKNIFVNERNTSDCQLSIVNYLKMSTSFSPKLSYDDVMTFSPGFKPSNTS